MVELKIRENEAGQRLDKYLHKYMKEAGNGFLYKMLRKKNITLNGRKAEGSERLCIGDEVKLFLSDETIEKFGGHLPGCTAVERQNAGKGRNAQGIGDSQEGRNAGNGWDIRKNLDSRDEGKDRNIRKNLNSRDEGEDRNLRRDLDSRDEGKSRNLDSRDVEKGQDVRRDGNCQDTEKGQDIGKGWAGQHSLGTGNRAGRETEAAQYRRAFRQLGKLEAIFENHYVLIVNKPPGILSQKAGPGDISLNEWLIGYLLENGEVTDEELHTFHPSVCNRLDRNTSGIVICGKTLLGSQTMGELLRDRKLRKFYRLYVKGRMEKAFSAEGYLMKDGQTNRVRLVEQAEGAAYIRTNFRPLRYCGDLTLAEAELITGKTHQIRLHLAGIGHPVLGDYKYGDKSFNDKFKKKYGVESQLLHACRLEFPVMEGEFGGLSGAALSAREPEVFRRIAERESYGSNMG